MAKEIHQAYKSSSEVRLRMLQIQELKDIGIEKSNQFVKDSLDGVKDTMLEYFI